MSSSRLRLTPTLQQLLCAYLRSGAFPFVAAQAVGVPPERFMYWMKKRPRFRDAALQAMAEARLTAESKVLVKNPLAWLKHGPGKETPNAPGWTNPPRGGMSEGASGKLLDQPEVQQFLATLLRVLEPYPEVKVAVAEALSAMNKE
jgi:hypothetical protein